MGIGIVVIIMVIAAIASAYATWAAAQRREDFARVADANGLQYSSEDPFDCTRAAFELFRKGDDRGAENVLWRNGKNDLPVRGFDYWYYDEHRDQDGGTTKSYKYFSCVLAQVANGAWPEISIQREGLLDKVASVIGFDDIDFESDDFNNMFAVRCADHRFAMALIDPRMMEFLLPTGGRFGFQLRGRWLLLVADRVNPSFVPALMKLCDGFIEHIPKVVWELYPAPVDEQGNALPPPDELPREAPEDEHDPFDALTMSPFSAFLDKDDDGPRKPEYDLDGNIIEPVDLDPWRDAPPRRPDPT